VANSLRELYESLQPDRWRKEQAFSEDIQTVNDLLFDPFATTAQRIEQLSNWCQRYQPCLFGRVAAPSDHLHFCVLDERDFLTKSDEEIAGIIHNELVAWKRRSLRPTSGFSTPAFGFILAAASRRLAYASPDDHLEKFARKLMELWGCVETDEPSGVMNWETLFIQHPDTRHYYRFTFSVDFFGAQGDGRWWHDHRCPGGLLFTANSVGHMRRYREWYDKKQKNQADWVLQTAMLTIAESAPTKWGHATWLRSLDDKGQPVAYEVACPFSKEHVLNKRLEKKDWTKYAGWLHTDHSIRPEFFHEAPEPPGEVRSKEYLQDFLYLYDASAKDHIRFIEGERVSEEEVREVLAGLPHEWKEVHNRQRRQRFAGEPEPQPTPPDAAKRIAELLDRGRAWRLSQHEVADLE
jgi:hypothetical protein